MKNHTRLGAIAIALFLFQSAHAADDELFYRLGGGIPIGSGATNMNNTLQLGAGVAWNSDLTCGNFDINTSITNQLNGVTGAFQNLMGNVIQTASGVVASLPALIIQRLNPALYDLLQNGVLQASEEFHLGELKCEEIVEKLGTTVANDEWGTLARGGYWTQQSNTAGTDILDTKDNAETAGLDNGVTWVEGNQAGGQGQPPIVLNNDVTVAGYNMLLQRAPGNANNVPVGTCANAALCTIWTTPGQAAAWVTDVLGDKQIQTCTGCNKVVANAGMGLQRKYEQERLQVETTLTNLVNSPVPPNAITLAAVQGGQGFTISRPIIEAIREEEEPNVLIARLAGELALSRTLERALLARRTILAGSKEPNVANNEVAQEEIRHSIEELNGEIENMVYELEVRQTLASNTTVALLQRMRIRNQAPVVEFPADQTIRDGATN